MISRWNTPYRESSTGDAPHGQNGPPGYVQMEDKSKEKMDEALHMLKLYKFLVRLFLEYYVQFLSL